VEWKKILRNYALYERVLPNDTLERREREWDARDRLGVCDPSPFIIEYLHAALPLALASSIKLSQLLECGWLESPLPLNVPALNKNRSPFR
jgi:hypothetical protein